MDPGKTLDRYKVLACLSWSRQKKKRSFHCLSYWSIGRIEIVRLFWHPGIERQAAEIEDPLERLRYLRQTAGRPAKVIRVLKWRLPPDFWKAPQFWKARRTWIVLGLAVLTAVAWRPGHTTSRSASAARLLPRPPLMPPPAGGTVTVPAPNA